MGSHRQHHSSKSFLQSTIISFNQLQVARYAIVIVAASYFDAIIDSLVAAARIFAAINLVTQTVSLVRGLGRLGIFAIARIRSVRHQIQHLRIEILFLARSIVKPTLRAFAQNLER